MSDFKIITNNVPRDVIDASELTLKEQARFDYLDWPALERGEDSASFIRYRGEIYDLSEFDRWDNPMSPTSALTDSADTERRPELGEAA